ncbi:MAG: extracellular solute-binding protein [Spirochaetia bacterium]|nr:extracellular solute-binding protein [Spirochaetia bacterium]MCF7946748.1 extracellular solute-binding protein [Spirochaetia bacterium]MCF7952460.1 extracellular solute-binding protein [Spirochaetales bacterium]
MKKTLIMLFVILICSPLFVGAQGQQDAGQTSDKVVIDVMAYGDNSNQEGVSWKRIVDTFEQNNPNIEIDYELLYDEAYHQKVVARLAAGDVPDMAYMGADARWGAPWKEAGEQWDHRDFLDPMYDRELIPAMGPNGEIYEIPLGTSNITTVLYMNKDLVESLGFSTPETYEDIVDMVPAARKAGLDVITIDGADGWAWGSCLLSAVIARMSGDPQWVSKAVAGENHFDDPAMVKSLEFIEQMVDDGVITKKSVLVDYGANTSKYNNKGALFMIQGQWVAGSIENPEVKAATHLLAWPELPGEKEAAAGSVAAAIQVGYGITQTGASKPEVRDAALKFLNYFYSEPESTQRLRDGAIIAPILKDYQVPEDIQPIVKRKVELAQTASYTEVIDAFLTGPPNDALNSGMQKIVAGQASPKEIAEEVERLARK